MTTRHESIQSLPEQSLTLYVEQVIECARRQCEVNQLKSRIDQALDEGNRIEFYRLSYQLMLMLDEQHDMVANFSK